MANKSDAAQETFDYYDPSEGVTGLEFAVLAAIDGCITIIERVRKFGNEILSGLGSDH